ncbi:CAAX prenyl protease 1 [Hanseniaspora opuntiae]|uniref:CAAX prenyl protease n=1 Tax=Hanseniaspora opuntiae TaxID=211096 RepID=A0A1E5RZP0_9ASCO|nr:CAAX prenyl protease 1 [Hanseniaspora opuntiae]
MSFSSILNNTTDLTNFPFKKVIFGITCANFLFERYVAYRQYKLLKSDNKKVPQALKGKVDEEKLVKSDAYGLAKNKFKMVSSSISLCINLAKLNMYSSLWNYSVSIGNCILSTIMRKPFVMSLNASNVAFFILSQTISTLLNLPVSYYQHFVLEEEFGFNKMTKSLFFMDSIKILIVGNAIGSIPLYILGLVLKKCTENFVFYIWMFIMGLQITLFFLSDLVIQPLFYTFTPLNNKELEDKINALAKECGFPLSEIYMIDGSKRSSHSNAYFSGLPFMKKKIVIFDTLIKDSSIDEVVAVLGHEIGHWKMNHISQMLIINQVHLSTLLMLFDMVFKNVKMFADFNFIIDPLSKVPTSSLPGSNYALVNDFPFFVGLLVFSQLMQPTDLLMNFGMNLFSRHNEYQADNYAVKLGKGEDLKKALIQLQITNLSTISVDKLFSMYHYTHPVLCERLEAIDKYTSEQEKKSE